MVCFVPSICLSIRKSCQRCDCSELGTVQNWVDHCIINPTFIGLGQFSFSVLIGHRKGSTFTGTYRNGSNYRIGPKCAGHA